MATRFLYPCPRRYSLGKGNFHSQPKLATMPALLREIDAATKQFCGLGPKKASQGNLIQTAKCVRCVQAECCESSARCLALKSSQVPHPPTGIEGNQCLLFNHHRQWCKQCGLGKQCSGITRVSLTTCHSQFLDRSPCREIDLFQVDPKSTG